MKQSCHIADSWSAASCKTDHSLIGRKNVEQCEPDVSPLGQARQSIKIKQGLETEVAKQDAGGWSHVAQVSHD